MSYVEQHLIPGERIVYRAHIHKIAFILPVLATLVFWVLAVVLALNVESYLWIGAALAGLAPLIGAYIAYVSSEFAVTDKRVVIKVGWIQRRTLELLLTKVEAVGVDQGIIGRILDYGTLTVTGTGGTNEKFQGIASPLEFRRQVHAQVSSGQPEGGYAAVSGGEAAARSLPREERDCPFCAEPILARARVCKHCGRDVDPLAST